MVDFDMDWGDHYWMVDFDMDCTDTQNGWFEVKAYITNGGKLYTNLRLIFSVFEVIT